MEYANTSVFLYRNQKQAYTTTVIPQKKLVEINSSCRNCTMSNLRPIHPICANVRSTNRAHSNVWSVQQKLIDDKHTPCDVYHQLHIISSDLGTVVSSMNILVSTVVSKARVVPATFPPANTPITACRCVKAGGLGSLVNLLIGTRRRLRVVGGVSGKISDLGKTEPWGSLILFTISPSLVRYPLTPI